MNIPFRYAALVSLIQLEATRRARSFHCARKTPRRMEGKEKRSQKRCSEDERPDTKIRPSTLSETMLLFPPTDRKCRDVRGEWIIVEEEVRKLGFHRANY